MNVMLVNEFLSIKSKKDIQRKLLFYNLLDFLDSPNSDPSFCIDCS